MRMVPRALALLILAGCRPSADEARSMLSSTDPEKRSQGAAVLQRLYDADPKSLGDHGKAYWTERTQRAVGRPESEALSILESPECRGGEAGGGGETRTCRLDDFWIVDVGVSTRGDRTLFHISEPRRFVRRFEVQPPPGFTGTWTTYLADGSVFESVELEDGDPTTIASTGTGRP